MFLKGTKGHIKLQMARCSVVPGMRGNQHRLSENFHFNPYITRELTNPFQNIRSLQRLERGIQ